MYSYLAVTKWDLSDCKRLLRMDEEGNITVYSAKKKSWVIPKDAIGGIYTGETETQVITKEEADKIIERDDLNLVD